MPLSLPGQPGRHVSDQTTEDDLRLRLDRLAIQESQLPEGTLLLLATSDTEDLRQPIVSDQPGLIIGDEVPDELWASIRKLRFVAVERSPEHNELSQPGSVRSPAARSEGAWSIADGDLLGLAEALADVLDGPVVIEDADFNVLAYSTYTGSFDRGRDSTILGRRTPQEWVDHLSSTGTIDRLVSTSDVIEITDGPREARRRFVTAIRSDGMFQGLLWLAEGERPLPPDAERLLKRAASITADHLVHHEAYLQERAASNGVLARGLLRGEHLSRSVLEELGFDRAAQYALIGLRLNHWERLEPRARARLITTVTTYCRAYRWNALPCGVGDTVYVIVGLSQSGTDDRYERVVEGLGQGLLDNCSRAFGRRAMVVVSDAAPRLRALPELVIQIDRGLEYCEKRLPDMKAVSFRSVRKGIALDIAAAAVHRDAAFAIDDIESLRKIDLAEGTGYLDTLSCFIDSLGNVRAAAERLTVHVTTLRYRLDRIKALTGLDVHDADTRYLCALLLRGREDHRSR